MRILITGATGMLGRSLVELLQKENQHDIIAPTSKELNICDKEKFYHAAQKADCIIHLVTKKQMFDEETEQVLSENRIMNESILHAAKQAHIQQFITVGTILLYEGAIAPLKEDDLRAPLAGYSGIRRGYTQGKYELYNGCLELAKQGTSTAFVILPSLFGPHDKFGPQNASFIEDAIVKIVEAKQKNLAQIQFNGGSGGARDYLYVNDAARIIASLINRKGNLILNAGCDNPLSPKELAEHIATIVKYHGLITFKSDGGPDYRLDTTRLQKEVGITYTPFDDALEKTIHWYESTSRK